MNAPQGGGFAAFVPIIILLAILIIIYVFVIKPRMDKQQPQQASQFSSFQTTRVIAQIISFLGWILLAISLFLILESILEQTGIRNLNFILISSAGGVIGGLVLIVMGQLTRAVVDNTDYTREMVRLLKENIVNN